MSNRDITNFEQERGHMRFITIVLFSLALIFMISGEAKAATNIKFFPPDDCGSGAFVWDGVTNVRCVVLPLCQAGQGLVYDATLKCQDDPNKTCGGFACTWPPVGPPPCQTDAHLNVQACPA